MNPATVNLGEQLRKAAPHLSAHNVVFLPG